ncbi:MAG TPA: class I tRNA ligase family protein, partial [Candidatus Thermoplasmatota archaeon]|nr:class I tRNA ligase family protein [Candidatus Thermoplasmatota archaeon]
RPGAKGIITDAAGKYAGQSVQHARDHILQDLDREGRLLHQKHIEHAVNVHERCGTPIEFLLTKQWFVRYLDLKETFLARGQAVRWHPEYMRVRYDNWVKGLKWDWCISRQRYFGVPFPVWYCEGCGEAKLAGLDELPVDPTVDKPKGPCAKCGHAQLRGETDVMDTWATSSLTPQIAILTAAERLGAPGARLSDLDSNPALAKMMPMSLRSQAHEIISFWAFNTVVKAHFHHGKVPWSDTMISGFVKLGKGKKMSKSKGDVVEPLEVIREFSADALRYWSATGANLGEDIIWNPKDLTRAQRLVTKLRNVTALIARALGDDAPREVAWEKLPLVDQWILAEYARLVKDATGAWDGYDYTRAVKDTENFLWHVLADHYLELVKHRIYANDPAAKHTLRTVGLGLLKLLAPVLCFATEDLYQQVYRRHEGAKSVHVARWPEPPRADGKAIAQGALVRDVVAAVRNWKSQAKMALNQDLPPLEVVAGRDAREALERAKADVLGTTRVADVHFVDAKEVRMMPVSVEPVHAKVGPKYRQDAKAISDAIRALDPQKVGPDGVSVKLPTGATFRIEPGEYEVKSRPTLHGAEVEAIEVAGVTLLLRK